MNNAPDYRRSVRLSTIRLAGAAALLLCLNCTVQAADALPSYPEILVDDVKHVLTSPTRWQEQEWQNLGLAAISVIGVAVIIDRPLRDEMRHHAPNNNDFMLKVERFGAEYSLGMLGGFYLAGAIGNNDKAAAVAQDGLAASLIASGIVTPTIKFVTDRSRPFGGSNTLNSSFPSGHTTQAFALDRSSPATTMIRG
jgi:hypothetical protein